MSSRFARNTLYSSIAGLFYSLGRFGTTIVVARVLGVDGTGVVSYALWVVALATALTDLGAYATLTRYLPEVTHSGEPSIPQRLATHLFIRFAGVVALGTLAFVAAAWWASRDAAVARALGLDAPPLAWVLVGLLYGMQALANFALGYLQGMQRFAQLARLAVITMAAQLTIVGVGGSLWGANGALLGYVAGFAVPSALCLVIVGRDGSLPEDLRARLRAYAGYAWASTIANAFIWARLETAFLNHYHGSEQVGLYAVGFTLASLATQGPMLLTGGFLPYFAERSGEDRRSEANRMLVSGTLLLAFLMLPMCFGVAALIPELLPLLYGREFESAVPGAVVLVIAAGLGANCVVPQHLINGVERSDFMFACNLFGAVLSVLLSLALVPPFGLLGAASARAVVLLYVLGMCYWFVNRRLGYAIDFSRLARLLVAALGCAAAARFACWAVPGMVGLGIAVPLGALTYVVLVRWLKALPSDDAERLRSLVARLPAKLQRPAAQVLVMIASPRHG